MKVSRQRVWLIGLGALLATNAFAKDQKSGMSSSNKSASSQTEVKVRDLNRHPEKFSGQQVMVTGKVDRIEESGAFVLDGPGIFNDKILVVVASNKAGGAEGQREGTAAPTIRQDEKLQLTGKVEEMALTKVEERYGPLKSEIKSEFEGIMPVLVVQPNGIKALS